MNKAGIASDLQFTHHSGHKFKGSAKVHQIFNPKIYSVPFYIGFAGGASECQRVISWLVDCEGPTPKIKGSEFVILTADKKMFTFNDPAVWLQITDPYYAIGTGMQYAIGAMASGKTPLEAVKIAAKHDTHTGYGFKEYSFAQKEKAPIKGPDLVIE